MPVSTHAINEGERPIGFIPPHPPSLTNYQLDNDPRIRAHVGEKVRDRTRLVQGNNIALADLKIVNANVEGEESLERTEQSEAGRFSRSGLSKSSPSYDRTDHVDAEIRGPVQGRAEREIQFAELPHPVKRGRENSQSTTSLRDFLTQVSPNESTVDLSEEILRKRTITFENPERQLTQNSFQPRFKRTISRTTTSESIMNDRSSQRSTERQMTLPYLSFAATIGRNSVSPLKLWLTLVISRID